NAIAFLAGAHVLCGDAEAAYPVAERTILLASEYAFPLWLAGGQMLRGWARSNLGDVEQGLPEIRKSVRALEATGALIWVQFARCLLAQAFAKAEQLTDAMKLVDQTLLMVAGTSGRWYEAELHRLKGDLLVHGGGSTAAAEACYGHRCCHAPPSLKARQPVLLASSHCSRNSSSSGSKLSPQASHRKTSAPST